MSIFNPHCTQIRLVLPDAVYVQCTYIQDFLLNSREIGSFLNGCFIGTTST